MFDEQYWEERYRSRPAVWSKQPNAVLVAEATDLPPGTALDVGSGEGADAIWLAGRGWQVTAVDIASTALQRAAAQADAAGGDVAARIRWVRADLSRTEPDGGPFDLVTAHFVHLPVEQRVVLFTRLANLVAPGGDLLVVGHHPSDLETTVARPPVPELFYTADNVADALSPDQWDVLVADARPRTVPDPDGNEVTIHDAVLHARKRR